MDEYFIANSEEWEDDGDETNLPTNVVTGQRPIVQSHLYIHQLDGDHPFSARLPFKDSAPQSAELAG